MNKVTALLLSVATRLERARAERWSLEDKVAASSYPTPRQVGRLKDQLQEARVLRTTIERRSRVVAGCCALHLGARVGEQVAELMVERAGLVVERRVVEQRREEVDGQLQALGRL